MRAQPLPIKSRDDLCVALKTTHRALEYFAHNVTNHVQDRKKPKKNGGHREYVAPSKDLKQLQRRIKEVFLDDFEYPDYTYGLGVKTLKDHARVHLGSKELVQMDLRDFFPSITHKRVYDMWVGVFSLSPGLARLLTKLTTHNGYLQQGFPTSSHIAAIISRDFTSQVSAFCAAEDIRFTQYVDDLNFSAKTIDVRRLFREVIKRAHKSGFAVKKNKTTVRSRQIGKAVTGVSILKDRLRATRVVRGRAIKALKDFADNPKDTHRYKRVMGYFRYLSHLNRVDGQKYRKAIETAAKSKNGDG